MVKIIEMDVFLKFLNHTYENINFNYSFIPVNCHYYFCSLYLNLISASTRRIAAIVVATVTSILLISAVLSCAIFYKNGKLKSFFTTVSKNVRNKEKIVKF